MSVGIILQARLTSERFPNKLLCPLYGKPVIQWAIEACQESGLPMVIAIPDKRTDWGLAEWLKLYDDSIPILCGHPEDLVTRFQQVNKTMKFDPIIRVCGDSPFIKASDFKDVLYQFNKYKCFQRVNLLECFSAAELQYVADNDPFIDRREHCVNMLNQTVDKPEDIDRLENEWLINRDNTPSPEDQYGEMI